MRRFLAPLPLLAACAAEPPSAPAAVTSPVAVEGMDQLGTPGYELAESLAVRITDADGNPVPGITVTWEAQARSGTVSPRTTVTDAGGMARASWRMPSSEGTHWASARASALVAASFRASAQSAALTSVGGDSRAMCGLTSAGTLRCWLPPSSGRPPRSYAVATPDRYVVLAFAAETWCAVTETGRIACLPLSDLFPGGVFAPSSATPRLLTSFGPRLRTLAAARVEEGDPAFCGVDAGGVGWCWGSNALGHMGDGTRGGSAEIPQRVALNEPLVSIDVSEVAACGLAMTGFVHCWGSNATALIGAPAARTEALVPTLVGGTPRFFALALTTAGTACGLDSGGKAHCWGRAAGGALGRPGVTANDPAPRLVLSDNVFVSIARMGNGFGTVSVDRELVAWGAVASASGTDAAAFDAPRRLTSDERYTAMLPGGTHGYACMKSLVGGSRCVDLTGITVSTIQDPVATAQLGIFGIPIR